MSDQPFNPADYTPTPPASLPDFIACAIADDSVARWNDTQAAARVLAMPEMQAVRKALRQTVAVIAVRAIMPMREVMTNGAHMDPLPASVVAWVLEGEQ